MSLTSSRPEPAPDGMPATRDMNLYLEDHNVSDPDTPFLDPANSR